MKLIYHRGDPVWSLWSIFTNCRYCRKLLILAIERDAIANYNFLYWEMERHSHQTFALTVLRLDTSRSTIFLLSLNREHHATIRQSLTDFSILFTLLKKIHMNDTRHNFIPSTSRRLKTYSHNWANKFAFPPRRSGDWSTYWLSEISDFSTFLFLRTLVWCFNELIPHDCTSSVFVTTFSRQ